MPRRTDKMPSDRITELSSHQKAAIGTYKNKWHSFLINNQTEPIQAKVVRESLELLYLEANFPQPQIIFFDNPYIAIKQLIYLQDFKAFLGKQIKIKLMRRIYEHNNNLVNRQLTESLLNQLINWIIFIEDSSSLPEHRLFYFPMNVSWYIGEQLQKDFHKLGFSYIDISYFTRSIFRPMSMISDICRLDFCISCLNLQQDKNKWKILQDLILHSGLIFTFEKVCLICDRPLKITSNHNDFFKIDNQIEIAYLGGYTISQNI